MSEWHGVMTVFTRTERTRSTHCGRSRGVLGCDMETAALFVIGKLRGVKTASVLNTVVEYEDNLEDNINNYTDGVNATVQGEKTRFM